MFIVASSFRPRSGLDAVLLEIETLSQSESEIDDIVNDLADLGLRPLCWQSLIMTRKATIPAAAADQEQLAPITAMTSLRLMVLANLLKRGAILRYKRLAGLSSVEFGLVASLGRRP